MPALFTRMSSRPYAAIVASISRFQSVSDVTSVRTKRACAWPGGDIRGNGLAFL